MLRLFTAIWLMICLGLLTGDLLSTSSGFSGVTAKPVLFEPASGASAELDVDDGFFDRPSSFLLNPKKRNHHFPRIGKRAVQLLRLG